MYKRQSELDPETKYPIIDIMRDQINVEDMGGTLRLGLYPSKLKRGSKAAAVSYTHLDVYKRQGWWSYNLASP